MANFPQHMSKQASKQANKQALDTFTFKTL
jgi:hypothetical protein